MIFHGFQKMTMLDYPGKVACTVFTAGCNFRCPFCHNASLVTEIDDSVFYSQEDILSYLKKRKGILDGICISGGEPLLCDGLKEFIKNVKEIGLLVKLDTNGSLPEKLTELINENLIDYIAMDIKNSKSRYGETIGKEDFDISAVSESVDILLSGKVDYEFRTTVVKELHTIDDINSIGEWVRGSKRFFLQNFVDSGVLIGSGLSAVDKETMEIFRSALSEFVDAACIRGI